MTYPLPWCEWLDCPYWKINLALCFARPAWRKWQSGKPMAEIIPEIDRLRPELTGA
jgi:hypothetical protein